MPKYIRGHFEENFTFFLASLLLGTTFLWLHHIDNFTIILSIFSQKWIKPELLDFGLEENYV